ncbi:MAG TPA: serine hydrolase domain-containing protein, partial [Planctomycetota bacterium]|nr:serine hydrolase domain-containing protein [Planctomycetota bacterium]
MAPLVFLLTLVSLLAPLQVAPATDRFPTSTAAAEHVSPEGLAALGELVRSFVEKDEVVGAELLVIVHGRTILHEGYGWRDRDGKVPMQPGGVFCVRSMTKPLIGAATWMLIEAGKLAEDDHVAEYLPSFDVEGQRDITIGQLLRHQSGLPMSQIMTTDPRTLKSLRSVADLGASAKLEFAPGTGFEYSDQGTDTLAAV